MKISMVAGGLDHPECVAVGKDGMLYAGGEAGQIYRIEPNAGTVEEFGSTGGFVLGIALDEQGNVYACDTKRRSVVRVSPLGDVETIFTGTPQRALVTPNYLVFDAKGNLYVSDSGTWSDDSGCIYRIESNGATEIWSEGAPRFTNGMALSADGTFLYVAESTLPGVTRIPIQEDGSAGPPELVSLLPDTVPDGLAFDTQGRLYIACYRPDRIYTLDPGGSLNILAEDFQGTVLAAPTNIAFGGADMTDIYVASLGRWHIGRLRAPAAGVPLHFPKALLVGEK